jgi:hypothetical protein
MITPSDEQRRFIDLIAQGDNVVGDCVAGSGKTTTVLMLAEHFTDKSILQITYNSQLKTEVRKKVESMEIQNLEVHTYHSLALRYYAKKGFDDKMIRKAMKMQLGLNRPEFDIIVIDEAQDMTPLFYGLMRKFIRELQNPKLQLIVLGDKYQGIYQFKGADSRFLTLTHKLWDREFENATLSTSYRITQPVASFVNECMLGFPRMNASKPGANVQYIRCNAYKVFYEVADRVCNLMEVHDLQPQDVFVLAGSIKSARLPIHTLENEFVRRGIQCHYPTGDDRVIDEDVIRGKVVFSTFHQAKGRERAIVVIYGFDAGYFNFHEKVRSPLECPETLYVAATRAKQHLILLEDTKQGPLPFLKHTLKELEKLPFVDYHEVDSRVSEPFSRSSKTSTSSPTEITKFLKDDALVSLTELVDKTFETETKKYYSSDITSKIQTGEITYEDVSDINGIAIPAMYEAKRMGVSTIEQVVRDKCKNREDPVIESHYSRNRDVKSVSDYLHLTLVYNAFCERLHHRLVNIKSWDWLTDDSVKECITPLYSILPMGTMYENEILANYPSPIYGIIKFTGFIDAITDDTLWEIKCTSELSLEHHLQLVVYAWMMMRKCPNKNYKFKLINLKTGEIRKIQSTEYIDEMMAILINSKFSPTLELTDDQFVDFRKTESIPSKL